MFIPVQISADGQHCISSIRNCVGVVPFLEEDECRRQCEAVTQCRHYQYDPGTLQLTVLLWTENQLPPKLTQLR